MSLHRNQATFCQMGSIPWTREEATEFLKRVLEIGHEEKLKMLLPRPKRKLVIVIDNTKR